MDIFLLHHQSHFHFSLARVSGLYRRDVVSFSGEEILAHSQLARK
jgi:hypothetical protein